MDNTEFRNFEVPALNWTDFEEFHKVYHNLVDARVKLFNIKEDPYESNNLALDKKNWKKVEEIHSILVKRLIEMDPPPDQTTVYSDLRFRSTLFVVVLLGFVTILAILMVWCICRAFGGCKGEKGKEKEE